jgi:hypothetical protein
VLIHFPIALFVIGAMFDLLSRGKRDSQLASAAYWRIECQCVPWLEHEILHRSESDWTFASVGTVKSDSSREPEPTAYTLISTFPGGLRFLPNAGSISARPASVKRGRGARWLLANPDAEQSIRR